jgi:hypothetical protein
MATTDLPEWFKALATLDLPESEDVKRWLTTAEARLPDFEVRPAPGDAAEWVSVHAAHVEALARTDPPAATVKLRRLVEALPDLPLDAASDDGTLLIFKRLLADLTGGSITERPTALKQIASAVTVLADANLQDATTLATQLFRTALDGGTDESRESNASAVLAQFARRSNFDAGVWVDAIATLNDSLSGEAADRVTRAALDALLTSQMWETALLVAKQFNDVDARHEAAEEIEQQRQLSVLAAASTFDDTFIRLNDEPKLAAAFLIMKEQVGGIEALRQGFEALTAEDFLQPRYRMFSAFLPLVVPALREIGGTRILDEMLDCVSEAERRLLAAAELVGTIN